MARSEAVSDANRESYIAKIFSPSRLSSVNKRGLMPARCIPINPSYSSTSSNTFHRNTSTFSTLNTLCTAYFGKVKVEAFKIFYCGRARLNQFMRPCWEQKIERILKPVAVTRNEHELRHPLSKAIPPTSSQPPVAKPGNNSNAPHKLVSYTQCQ
jgi:hypothetical protein